MPNIIAAVLLYVLEKVLSFAFKKLLIGAGIGLASFALTQTAFSFFLDFVHARFNDLASIFFIIQLTGLDVALSYVISAVSIRLTMNAGKLAFRKI
ncbi:DUF2523 domain-containing protein [Acinetobacter wuhouensis]|uniref:DUF2523 family protein n=1 Tax=Acinetobacter wuhouensis TaxID=1879050 RepID=UPI0010236E2B|nr:DUF2523 family protein [Acinetobacter wuhouensis]RZG66680.1 DUF2523 domain-containing protein [Acinetobacter wuhouensis]